MAGVRVVLLLSERSVAGWQYMVGAHVIVQRQTDLVQVIAAGRAPSGLAAGLDGGQDEADQDADDGNHNQQLDEAETVLASHRLVSDVW